MNNSMPQLNLPHYDFRLQVIDDSLKIFDPIRRKFVAATPEEWVRQNFLQFLIRERQFPAGRTKIEQSISAHGRSRRCDAVIYSRNLRAVAIVECKAPSVAIRQATFDQIAMYNSALQAGFLLVSNGLEHYCAQIDFVKRSYSFLPEIPAYAQLVGPDALSEHDRSD